MELVDFKNRLFQFQETQLPERKQILLTVLLILIFLSAPLSWILQNPLGKGGAIRRPESAIKS